MALILVAGGCAIVDVTNLASELEQEGFDDVTTTVEPDSVLVVSARSPSGATTEEAQDQAAEIVWERFPRSFEGLRLTVDGETERLSYDDLEDELGPRDEDLDAGGDVVDDVTRSLVVVVVALVAGALALVLIVAVVAIVLTRRSRRRRATPTPVGPWAPPVLSTTDPARDPTTDPTKGPIPPPAGWGNPAPGAAPSPPPPPDTPRPVPTWTPAPPRPRPVDLRKVPVETKADRRRLGRRPRGPLPDAAHTPPGWD